MRWRLVKRCEKNRVFERELNPDESGPFGREQTGCIGEKERDEEASIWRAAEQTDEKESKRMRRRANETVGRANG